MRHNSHQLHCELRNGAPIGLRYLAVSFIFGIMAGGAGLTALQPVAMSFTNLTSAGQPAALGIIQAGVPFMGMAMTQLIISLRYCLMSCSLSQKLSTDMPLFRRLFMSYGVTDEIFGASVCRPGCLSPLYDRGLICVVVPNWTLGALLGAVSEELSPARLLSALNVALYEMLLVVVISPVKISRILTGVIFASMALSLVFAHVPFLVGLSSGFKIIPLVILTVGVVVILSPVKEGNKHES